MEEDAIIIHCGGETSVNQGCPGLARNRTHGHQRPMDMETGSLYAINQDE